MAADFGQGDQVLSRAATMVAQCKTDMDGISGQMMGHVEALRAQWGGTGSNAFVNLGNAWNEKQRRIVSALNEFEQNLLTTERTNTTTDDEQQSAMSNLQNTLGALPNG